MVRHVFEDLLKVCDMEGRVDMTRQALSRRFNVPMKELNRCLEKLEEPDPASRDAEHDGRRLEKLDEHRDWGWQILNYEKYDSIRVKADVALRVARHRERKRIEEARSEAADGDGTTTDPSKSLPEAARGQSGASGEGVTPDSGVGVPEIATTPGGRGGSYRGKPPSLDEVQAAASMLGVPLAEADKFHQHYSSTADEDENGREFWQVNGAKVTNWRSLLAKWGANWRERNHKNRPNQPEHPPIVPMNHIERDPAP